jgi:hypothetical protein
MFEMAQQQGRGREGTQALFAMVEQLETIGPRAAQTPARQESLKRQ